MPPAPIQPMAGLPTLTSSELYTQTLAAQADVLVAAKAWPLLTKSLADLTDIPGRQQLAIVMGRSLTGSVFTQADLSNQVISHPGNFPGYTLLQELEDIVNRDPRFLYEDQGEYDLLEAGDQDLLNSSVTSMRHTYMAQAIGGALADSASTYVDNAYSQAQVALNHYLDKIQEKTRAIEASLNALQVAQARLDTLVGAGPDKIGIDAT
jgi:hypothetical protein